MRCDERITAEKTAVYRNPPAMNRIKINEEFWPLRLIYILKNFTFTLEVMENNFNVLI
jgi:hypothetical protein